jgi:serine/threonine protein kinase
MPDFFDFDADIDDVPQLTGILQFTDDQSKLKLARDYFIVKKIGEGGMGEVNLAKTFLFGDEHFVAVKILNKKDMPSDDSLQRFHRETQLLMKAKHNNIVKFIDYWESAMFAYLIMEYVDGTDLETCVQNNGPFQPSELIVLINPILQALLYMFKEHGMHHRDIKPNNIQMTNTEPKKTMLIDFGNAKIIKKKNNTKSTTGETPRSLTMISGQMSGTPGYIAPEVSMDNYKEQDDVFSIACTMLYCLLGNNPFEVHGDFFASFRKIQDQDLDLGKYEGTMIGHWIHINTSYNRDERMTLQQAFHSLERMQRNKTYPLKKVSRRVVEVMGSDKALMQLINKQNSEFELAASRGITTTGSFGSLETTRPGFDGVETRGGDTQDIPTKTVSYVVGKGNEGNKHTLLLAALGVMVVLVAVVGFLVVFKGSDKSKDDKGVIISSLTMKQISKAELVHWTTKLPFYRNLRSIDMMTQQKDGRNRLMDEAGKYYSFASEHEDALAYEQAELRWVAVSEKAPVSDNSKLVAIEHLHKYYCKQNRNKKAASMVKLHSKYGGKTPLTCK